MELYYKDLISEDTSLEGLVDNLMLVVQGADEFAQASSVHLGAESREEICTRLQRLKDTCAQVKGQAVAAALATDKVMRQYPYSCAGFAFALGLLAGVLIRRRRAIGQ